MRVTLATLADFASVRNGLLTIVGAGINQMTRASFPAKIEAWMPVMIEIEGDSIETTLSLNVVDSDGKVVASMAGALQADAVDEVREEFGYICLAIDARELAISGPGHHVIELRLGDSLEATVHFYARQVDVDVE